MQFPYDVAVGVRREALNAIAATFFTRNPAMFAGSAVVPGLEPITIINWKAVTAPVFDLSGTALPNLAAAAPAGLDVEELQRGLSEALGEAAVAATFSATVTDLAFFLKQGTIVGDTVHIAITATCSASVSDAGVVRFSVVSIRATSTGDPFTDDMINNQLLPRLTAMANALFSSVQLPKLEFLGVRLSPPTIIVTQQHLLATAFILSGGSGSSAILDSIPPSNGFFLLASPRAVQSAATAGSSAFLGQHIQGGGSVGDSWLGAKYSYDIFFGGVSAQASGQSIRISMPIQGGLGANVTLLFVPIGVRYSAKALPNPAAALVPRIVGGELWLTLASLDAFTIVLVPDGSIIEKILSFLAGAVIAPVVAIATPIATQFIRNISFRVWSVPTISIPVAGFTFRISVNSAVTSQFGPSLMVNAAVDVQVQSALDEAAEAELLLADAPPALGAPSDEPCSVSKLVYSGAKIGDNISGGLVVAGLSRTFGSGTITELTDRSLAAAGTYAVDFVFQGTPLKGNGTFNARLTQASDGQWGYSLEATGTWTGRWSGSIGCGVQSGQCVFAGPVNIGGVPLSIEIRVQPQSGSPQIRLFPRVTAPQPQVLPTGFALRGN